MATRYTAEFQCASGDWLHILNGNDTIDWIATFDNPFDALAELKSHFHADRYGDLVVRITEATQQIVDIDFRYRAT